MKTFTCTGWVKIPIRADIAARNYDEACSIANIMQEDPNELYEHACDWCEEGEIEEIMEVAGDDSKADEY